MGQQRRFGTDLGQRRQQIPTLGIIGSDGTAGVFCCGLLAYVADYWAYPLLKTAEGSNLPWVRIPLSPPKSRTSRGAESIESRTTHVEWRTRSAPSNYWHCAYGQICLGLLRKRHRLGGVRPPSLQLAIASKGRSPIPAALLERRRPNAVLQGCSSSPTVTVPPQLYIQPPPP